VSTGVDEVFRKDALEHRAAYKERGALLLATSLWGRLAYVILAGALVTAVALSSLVEIAPLVVAPAKVRGRELLASLPAATARGLSPGAAVRVTFAGFDTLATGPTTVTAIQPAGSDRVIVHVSLAATTFPFVEGMTASVEVTGRPTRLGRLLLERWGLWR
jgi:hypothetical protein